jgi:hypothetical protein
MPYKDPEKGKEYAKLYYSQPEQKEKKKIHYQNNKDKYRNWRKEYRKTDKGKKSYRISHWIGRGLIDDPEAVYKIYLETDTCLICDIVLTEGNKQASQKVMDHCHETGHFRGILCNSCNLNQFKF